MATKTARKTTRSKPRNMDYKNRYQACINPACDNNVGYGYIGVMGAGFVCTVECEDVVRNSPGYDPFAACV